MAVQPPLLFIFGSGDQTNQVSRSGIRTHVSGSTDLGRLLPPHIVRERLVVTPDFFRHARKADFEAYPVIANLITEAEHNVRILQSLDALLDGVPGRVINPPRAVLRTTRDQVAELLSGISGLIAPRTARFKRAGALATLTAAGVQPPVILRRAGTHGGKIIGLFDTLGAAVAALEGDGDHIATEFVDFRSPDGLYRKFRVFFIGHYRILRHMLIGEGWSVHGHERFDFMASRPELIAQERAMFESENPFSSQVSEVLAAIRERIRLDFFGLDFALTSDDRLVLFEANATMSFMPNLFVPQFDYLPRCHALAQAAFMELLGVVR